MFTCLCRQEVGGMGGMSVRACEATLGAKGARKELEESCQDAPLNQDRLQNLPELWRFKTFHARQDNCQILAIKSCQMKDTRIL